MAAPAMIVQIALITRIMMSIVVAYRKRVKNPTSTSFSSTWRLRIAFSCSGRCLKGSSSPFGSFISTTFESSFRRSAVASGMGTGWIGSGACPISVFSWSTSASEDSGGLDVEPSADCRRRLSCGSSKNRARSSPAILAKVCAGAALVSVSLEVGAGPRPSNGIY